MQSYILCRGLSELSLLYCQRIGNNALLEVGRGCTLLQVLHLVDCSSIGDDAIYNIALGCRNLKKLHIRRCYEVCYFGFVLDVLFSKNRRGGLHKRSFFTMACFVCKIKHLSNGLSWHKKKLTSNFKPL